MKSTSKQSICVINYNGDFNSDFDNNMEFIDINLLSNKLSVKLIANDSITHIKKKHVLKIKDEADKFLKTKVT